MAAHAEWWYRSDVLVDGETLDVKDELRVGRYSGESLVAIGQLGGNGDTTLTTNGDANDTDIPALDDFSSAKLEGERLALLVC